MSLLINYDTYYIVFCMTIFVIQNFKHHFNRITDKEDPIELTDAPAFIIKLQDVNIDIRTTPPDHQEMREVLTHLKNGKAANDIPAVYFKYAAQSEKLIDEMVRLYSLV